MNNKENIDAPQFIIEQKIKELVQSGNYEIAHLFTEEGFTLAGYSNGREAEMNRLTEIYMHIHEVVKNSHEMDLQDIREIVIEEEGRRKIIFRPVKAFNQTVILSLIVPPKKSYKGITNGLVKLIERTTQ